MKTNLLAIEQEIYSVSRLNASVKHLLENNFMTIWVEGEISNFSAPSSGHWYFSLKDTSAQVRCAMFRGNQRKIICCPKDGMHVLIKARVSLYENRGEYQLIAEEIEERGEGKLKQAFEALKKKLEGLGWFNTEHKKILPLFPKQIGVITSPTGAAIRDILHVLNRRYPCVPIIIYPTSVQGTAAAPTIVKAIQIANERQECDVLILARGGGSLEDLWPFNEEIVAAAIFNSYLPIISGIGHEIDFTIADFVADKRAPTPSAAAEIVTPDQLELLSLITRYHHQLIRKMQHQLSILKQKMTWIQKHLTQQEPKRRLQEKMQRIDFYMLTLSQRQYHLLRQMNEKLLYLQNRLRLQSPIYHITMQKQQLNTSETTLINKCSQLLHQKNSLLNLVAGKLHALSPLATLDRGYAIAMDKDKKLLSADTIKKEDKIFLQIKKRLLTCTVEKITKIK